MPDREIEFDHHPEVVEHNKGTRRLELLGLKETFADTEARRAYFATLDNERYTKLLGYINSVTRGQTIDYDYKDGRTPFLPTPPLEDKAPLMQDSFDTAREILNQDLLDDHTATRRAALTLAGAINYIHPYENGNGRTGRVMHYLMEFGSERGDQAFNDELYAIIAKIPVYETHYRDALDDTPPDELAHALATAAYDQDPASWNALDDRHQATARVGVFLKMMKGEQNVPVTQEVKRRYRDPLSVGPTEPAVTPPGTVDGLTLYERDYLAHSAIPHYQPDDVAAEVARNTARRPNSPQKLFSIPLEILED